MESFLTKAQYTKRTHAVLSGDLHARSWCGPEKRTPPDLHEMRERATPQVKEHDRIVTRKLPYIELTQRTTTGHPHSAMRTVE